LSIFYNNFKTLFVWRDLPFLLFVLTDASMMMVDVDSRNMLQC